MRYRVCHTDVSCQSQRTSHKETKFHHQLAPLCYGAEPHNISGLEVDMQVDAGKKTRHAG